METQTNSVIHAHDHFIRKAMSDPHVAREFFAAHLPTEILNVIDLNLLIPQPRSHVDDARQEAIVDMLFKTSLSGQEAYLYLLLEHQSTPDEMMAFRMLKYTCNIMDHHHKTTKKKTLPLIYPMVIYHAERPYPFSNDIKDLIDTPKELVDKYFLQPFHLIDLGRIADEELKKHAWAGVMEFALKHIFARNLLPHGQYC